MSEQDIFELIEQLQLHGFESEAFDAVLERCNQAIEWANQSQRWDLLIELTDVLSHRFAYSNPPLDVPKLGKEQAFETMREFWRQGNVFAMRGLMVARQMENRDKEIWFLEYLARLATMLQEFDIALDYIQQQACLVEPEAKWAVAYELSRLGQQASRPGDFATASECLLTSLRKFQELGDKAAMADVLLFLGWNELRQEKLSTARQFFERGIEAGNESNHLASVVRSLQGLGEVSRLAGEVEQARSIFRKALSIADSLKSPSADFLSEELRQALASLGSLT